jgi:predicted dienelactone hydrolase
VVLLWLFVFPCTVLADSITGVGLASIQLPDPINGGQMEGLVFYPASSTTENAISKLGPYNVAATFDAPALPGVKPLVVISHGHGGSKLGHHDLATWLASHGFVVVTFNQPKDNFRDQSGVGTPVVLAGRPIHVSATITYLLEQPRWKALIDPDRIGVAGFSAGGYTSLMMVGAVPRFDLVIGYCKRHPDDKGTCLFHAGEDAANPELQVRLADLQAGLTRWGPTADPRVKSAFAMAPLSLFFDEAGAASIDRPVFLYYGENDQVLLPSENALHIKPLMKTLTDIKQVPKADHWVFLAPCSVELAKDAPDICADPKGVDRTKVHAQLNADALAFFSKTLAAKSP